MDKNDMNMLSNMLFAELLIGTILYKSSSELTISDIKKNPSCETYSEEYIAQIVNDLISYGIVFPRIKDAAQIVYSITDFGKYYFERLSEENKDIEAMIVQL